MSDRAIAIVGASCRFPGAAGLEAYWRLLAGGIDAVSKIGPDRWAARFFLHPRYGEPGKTYSFAAGLIDGVDLFEPEFFGISPREAAQMDPQQRLLLELAWHAIEDAGATAARLAGSATGVYIGASSTDYGDLRLGDPASGDPYFVAGSTLSILANRISHVFDLRGPSETIDTACSSSLAALHAACEALRGGRIAAALVGGVNLLLSPYPFLGFAQAGMLSRRGRCHAFDARADGYVRAEGGGVVLLKPLAQAVDDGDAIRAVIRGTAVSASGRTLGLSSPSEAAQTALLREVYAEAGVAADAVAFFEMHGTGTPAGDPVEAAAVGAAIGAARTSALPIGSVKTNIGHLEPASGMAGLLKAMLALERGVVPASLHGETPNPAIAFDRLNLRLVRAAEPIAAGADHAGVNSFGFGGTNAHAVLGRPPERIPAPADTAPPPLLLSARSEASLRALAAAWRDKLAADPAKRAPLLRAAARRRDHHPHRLVVPGEDLPGELGRFLAAEPGAAVLSGMALREGRLAFVYAGNGAQFRGMGQAAYRQSAGFRAGIAEADAALAPLLGWSVAERVAAGAGDADIGRADVAQPMLFAIQTALTLALRALGARPDGFVGHSVGEIAAAWAAGGLTLADAARIVVVRSRHQERTRGRGRMAVLALGEDAAKARLAEASGNIEIAAINSSRSVTVAGNADAVEALARNAGKRGVACRVLDLDFAFHSEAMDPIREELAADLAGLAGCAAMGDLVSTVCGRRVSGGELDANHWWRNVRDPVRFREAIATLIAGGYRLFVEIGPRAVLQSYLHDALRVAGAEGRVLPALDRQDDARDPLPAIAGSLHVAGHDLSGAAMFDGPDDPRGLPLYPWQRQRYWFRRTVEAAERIDRVCDHKLLGFRRDGPLAAWGNHLDTALFPFLADHRVEGVAVLPAAAMADMALAAAQARYPDAGALELRDVALLRPMILAEGETRETAFNLVSADGDWQLSSRKRLAAEAMTVHATGRIAAARQDRLFPAAGGATGGRTMPGVTLYRRAARLGLDYGPSFRVVREVAVDDAAGAAVALLDPPPGDAAGYLIHPVALDGALQALLALLGQDAADGGFLPRRLGRVTAVAPFGRLPRRAELRLTYRGSRSVAADIELYDEAGDRVAELADCRLARVELGRSKVEAFLRAELVPKPLDPLPPVPAFGRLGETIGRAAGTPTGTAEDALLFEALLGSIVFEAVQKLGAPERLSAMHRRALALLRKFGAAAIADGVWRLVPENDLPDVTELWRTMLAESPETAAELLFLASLREELPALLRDGAPFDPARPATAAPQRAAPAVAAAKATISAALDAIAADWPCDRPLRVHQPATGWAAARLRRLGIAAVEAAAGEPCDLALSTGVGDLPALAAGLVPGGAVLAPAPLPNALLDLLFGNEPDWRAALTEAGLVDAGSAMVSLSPWPCAVVWARAPVAREEALPAARPLPLHIIGAGADLAEALADAGHAVVANGLTAKAGSSRPAMRPATRSRKRNACFPRSPAPRQRRRSAACRCGLSPPAHSRPAPTRTRLPPRSGASRACCRTRCRG
jgi:phthiocerol/phenolphthiocerol synthesis type-I polyketide synthase C